MEIPFPVYGGNCVALEFDPISSGLFQYWVTSKLSLFYLTKSHFHLLSSFSLFVTYVA